jgi:imidazolonepropionase
MLPLGITAVECKSGYGLDLKNELKLLRVYEHLRKHSPARIIPTLLAAHVVPDEFRDRRADYLDMICDELIPEAARQSLALFCDVFVEETAFQISEARRVLTCGKDHGLAPKIHADQLSAGGGAELAGELGAVSADHLEHVSLEGIDALAEADVTAVALPLVSLYLKQEALDCRSLIDRGVSVAVASDFNPGSSPSYHLPLAMLLAALYGGMTPEEVLRGTTINAARAVGLEDVTGSLEKGKSADFAIIDSPSLENWIYHFRPNACTATYVKGSKVWGLP